MILVDTSVLIDFLRDRRNTAVDRFERLLERGIPYGITECVYQEVLQGAFSQRDFRNLRGYLDTQVIYGVTRGLESYAQAAQMYFRCREKGVTPRGSLDCLICQVAIEHHLQLLHNDADFTHIARVIKELQIF